MTWVSGKRWAVTAAFFLLMLSNGYAWYMYRNSLAAAQPTPQADTKSSCTDNTGRDIYDDPDAIDVAIQSKMTCADARAQAENCAYGSTLDVHTTYLASLVCQNELAAYGPTKELLDAVKFMQKACGSVYANMSGTMYRSANGFCQLSAVEWAVDLAAAIEN